MSVFQFVWHDKIKSTKIGLSHGKMPANTPLYPLRKMQKKPRFFYLTNEKNNPFILHVAESIKSKTETLDSNVVHAYPPTRDDKSVCIRGYRDPYYVVT